MSDRNLLTRFSGSAICLDMSIRSSNFFIPIDRLENPIVTNPVKTFVCLVYDQVYVGLAYL
jgi:hypothetical protein